MIDCFHTKFKNTFFFYLLNFRFFWKLNKFWKKEIFFSFSLRKIDWFLNLKFFKIPKSLFFSKKKFLGHRQNPGKSNRSALRQIQELESSTRHATASDPGFGPRRRSADDHDAFRKANGTTVCGGSYQTRRQDSETENEAGCHGSAVLWLVWEVRWVQEKRDQDEETESADGSVGVGEGAGRRETGIFFSNYYFFLIIFCSFLENLENLELFKFSLIFREIQKKIQLQKICFNSIFLQLH